MAGLGASYAADFEFPIYEGRPYASGLCSSFEVQGFQFDCAVYLSFAASDIVRGVFDPIPHCCHHPKGRWVPIHRRNIAVRMWGMCPL